ncbi:MAG: ribonucleoside triphosphate reductase [Candidatus Hadarchaeales archaeon]
MVVTYRSKDNIGLPSLPKKVRKRGGRLQDFDPEKITRGIFRAAQDVGGTDRRLAEMITREVLEKLPKEEIVDTRTIGDIVEKVLIERGHAKTAKAYILYRRHREELHRLRLTSLEVERLVDEYIGRIDWRVNENANVPVSMSGLEHHVAGVVISNYTLSRVYPLEISDAHVNGDYHIHDLYRGITGYCAGWSLPKLLQEGFNGVPHRVSSKPPKHLDTALLQMVNFIGTLSNEWAGAMAFNSVDTLLAPFVRKDKLDYKHVKQAIQTFVFNLNVTTRFGGQTPFTNITLDLTIPEDLANQPAIVGGEPWEPYGDFQEEANMINRAFLEVFMEGDADGRPMTFPIPTYGITKDFEWDSDLADLLFEMTSKYGLAYFSNFISSDLRLSDVRSMCCRLRLDLRELRNKVAGGLFGAADATGSVGVVTINLPRIGYLSRNEDEFFERLSYIMELAKKSLEIKRTLVERNMQNGLLPYTLRYLGTLENHFSTIGLVGMHEACLNLLGVGIDTQEGHEFAIKVLDFMRERISDFQEETGHLFNLEATPAESTSYRLALIDKQKYPQIKTSGSKTPYYTNSTQLPVNYKMTLAEVVKHQEPLQVRYTGGTVLHVFVGEEAPDKNGCKVLIRRIFEKSRLPYVTITPTFSICPDHGYMRGKYYNCPKCGKQAEVYSRIVGYFRPVQDWNAGKKEEFEERSYYDRRIEEISSRVEV